MTTIGDLELKVTRYDVAGGVATLTLDRPASLNAWTGRMHHEFRAVLAEAERDQAVRAIVLTGAGRGFCAGADTRALDKQIGNERYDPGVVVDELPAPGHGLSPEYDHSYAYLLGILKPVIAAINGAVAGLGLVIACFCDVRFAAAGAKFTVAAPRLGLPAEFGLSWTLPRIVGLGHAADLLMSGRVILAEEAERMGLVNRVLPPEDLMGFVADYALDLARHVSPTAMAEAKRQLYADLHRGLGASVDDAEATLDRLIAGPDYKEGISAYLERRPPRF